jgi:hypothetical protein
MADSINLKELKRKVDAVIFTTSKADAARPLRELEFYVATNTSGLDPYLRGKLSEVVCYAKEASGQPRDKSHWAQVADSCWHEFESKLKRVSENGDE